jgi:ESS family glutamate:Na+ symporter
VGVCLLVIGRRLLPRRYWFELGILNYGMSTGTTATGLMLLRIIDRDLDSGAAEDYALAAPLSAPFVGGGMITFSLPVLLQQFGGGPVVAGLALGMVVLFVLGAWLAKGDSEA